MAKLLFVDNYDSFSYNLVDELRCLSHQVTVIRNQVPIGQALALAEQHDALIISPGPGAPADAGIGLELVQKVASRMPILGICLGHQMLVEAFGGKVSHATRPVHGKASLIGHSGRGCFAGLPNPMRVARYHSLVAHSLPSGFNTIAEVIDEHDAPIMAIEHERMKLLGFQFHPESILTTQGAALLGNSLRMLLEQS